MKFIVRNLLLLLSLTWVGCDSHPVKKSPQSGMLEAVVPLKNHSTFLSAVLLANKLNVYEGLPHGTEVGGPNHAETEGDDVFWIGGYPFYKKPLGVPKHEKERLTAIASSEENHLPLVGGKYCGGFHPDYAIVWESNGESIASLLCFQCREWKNYTSESLIHEDLSPIAFQDLQMILSKYER